MEETGIETEFRSIVAFRFVNIFIKMIKKLLQPGASKNVKSVSKRERPALRQNLPLVPKSKRTAQQALAIAGNIPNFSSNQYI